MALPPKISSGFPDEYDDLFQRLQLSTSLVDGLMDYMKRRQGVPENDLHKVGIEVSGLPDNPDPLDLTLKLLQEDALIRRKETKDLKEENRRIINALKSLDDTQQVLVAMVRPLIQKNERKRPKSK